MTVNVVSGDIFESDCDAIACPVNIAGVMGKGLALEFKKRYPAYFQWYRGKCENRELYLGELYMFSHNPPDAYRIVSFPTKDHWQNKSRYIDIQSAIIKIPQCMLEWGIGSLALPAVGCGLGELNFAEVSDIIISTLKNDGIMDLHELRVDLYEPQ